MKEVEERRNIRVYAFFGTHPIYETLVKYPPENIQLINAPPKEIYDSLSIYSPIKRRLKDDIKEIAHMIGIPRMIWLPTLNADLIHSSRGFLVLNRKPWVVDIEHIGSFGNFKKESVKRITLKFLSSNYCKKILPHCKASMYSFFNAWNPPSKIKNKTEVLYPAIEPRNFKKKMRKTIRIGFLATRTSFYEKGGRELLEAFKILSKKYDNIELWIKSKVPNELLKKYKNLPIKVIEENYLTRDELFKNFYQQLDIFCLPTYIDSFGYSLLEAMSVGLPIVATSIFAIPEIVEDGKSGFLISSPISDFRKDFVIEMFDREVLKKKKLPIVVQQLVEKLSLLIESSSLRRKMGRYGRMLVEKGKFSIKERNEKLRRIYEEALKR
jgi:glycosyltransferase involved in cell wall biosynthesis